jgi:hypothetical protein
VEDDFMNSSRPATTALATLTFLLAASAFTSAHAGGFHVERSGSFVESITVDGHTVGADALSCGKSLGETSNPLAGGNATAAADDLNLASYFARAQVGDPRWDIALGNWTDTNGDGPDFFVFEVGGNDPIEVAPIFADGSQGVLVPLSGWNATGFSAVGGPNVGQEVAGLAFHITDLRQPDGQPMSSGAAIRGIRIVGSTIDGAAFAAVDPLGSPALVDGDGQIALQGTRRKWQPLEVWFSGPWAEETDDAPNPFLDYRLQVTFVGPSGQTYTVPGFFDGDGRGAGKGAIWKAILAPDEVGTWHAFASFRSGTDVALELAPDAGVPAAFDGAASSFEVFDAQPGSGFYALGRLESVGLHHLKFRDGGFFLKGGTDSPENLLAYRGFDDTLGCNCGNLGSLHSYPSHVGDWQPGDPNFKSNTTGYDGRGLVGAINYLASQHVNSLYFLPMNLGGDGWDSSPFVGQENTSFDKTHYDVSKLAQWRTVFDHAARKGMLLHVVLAETEWQNEQWLDQGGLGRERKLFFRELVARFAHLPALKWNLSEENDYPAWMLREFADWLGALDAYDHPIAVHNHPNDPSMYQQLAGDTRFSATAVQYDPDQAGVQVEGYRALSSSSGHPWVVEMDENNPADSGLASWNAEDLRKRCLYDIYFSGAGGLEWYAGNHALPLGGDQSLEDFRTREEMWRYMWYARKFVQYALPFWEMTPADHLLANESGSYGGGEVLALPGKTYAIYLPSASQGGWLDLTGTYGRFRQTWYDPRSGTFQGTPRILQAGGWLDLGGAPSAQGEDWVVLVQRVAGL